MNSMQRLPLFESSRNPMKRVPEAVPAASGSRSDQDTAGEEAALSFPSLLAEKNDRLSPPETKTGKVEARVEGEVGGEVAPAGTEPAPGASAAEALDLAKVMAMMTEAEGTLKTAAAALQVPLVSPSATVAGDVPAILAQGLAVQSQTALGQAVQVQLEPVASLPNTALPATATPAMSAEQLSAQAAAKTAPQVPSVAAESAVNEAAKAATALSAADLETAVKGRETYSQVPIVSESQMMSDTLKNASKNSADNAAQAAVTEAAELSGPVVEASAEAGTNTESDADEAALPQAEAESAPMKLDAENFKPVAQAAKVPHEVVAETAPAETPAALNLDPGTMARPAPSTGQAAATHLAADPAVSRDINQQVVRHLSATLSDITGQQKMTIKLNPENLGQIELNFEARDDRLSVAISASTPEAEAALRDNMKDLTDRLVERSARFSHVDVRVEIKDGADTRQDNNKQDQKQDQKNDDRRENAKQDDGNGQGHHGHQDQQSARAQEAWESAMSWQLANEEG